MSNKPNITVTSCDTCEHYTPVDVIDLVKEFYEGEIDLDPATTEEVNEGVIQARKFFTVKEDGLKQSWGGKVFLNPPYSSTEFYTDENGNEKKRVHKLMNAWINKAIEEINQNQDSIEIILLVNGNLGTSWFNQLLKNSAAMCFVEKRLKFMNENFIEQTNPVKGNVIFYLHNEKLTDEALILSEGFQQVFSKLGYCVQL